jgi:pyruvate dehydrogenase E1 component subunit beta
MPEMAFRDALRDALRKEMQENERVIVMGEDIGAYGGSYGVTRGLLEEFGPERIIDTPISELGFVGCGIGAAMAGLRPVVEIMTINFSFLALDQIINSASKVRYMSGGQMSVPIVIRMASGGGLALGAQHSHSLEGWYAHIPGLKVATPATPYDAKGLLRTALKD